MSHTRTPLQYAAFAVVCAPCIPTSCFCLLALPIRRAIFRFRREFFASTPEGDKPALTCGLCAQNRSELSIIVGITKTE